MATRRTVDLGVVGFGLVPDTRQLELSLTRLRAFGKNVERLGTHTEEVVQKQYQKFARLERILTTLFTRVQATTERMRAAGVAAAEIDKVTNAYSRLNRTIIQNADAISRSQLNRGVVGMSAIIQRGNRLATAQEASRMTVAFRDLERAAILAVGPLSGIGARLAVMAALFESTSAKMAISIAATTGVTVGLGLMAAAGVKAAMDMERFEAQLTASTGSLALVGDAFNHVNVLANKLGHNVRDIIEPYAKFTTAARLSNVAVAEQKKIFESALIAGTAMKLNGERMGLVFLALEQMLSKGTVTMEELRRQLGDLLPGSFELAAQAMGVSGEQMAKMIRSGEVLAKDLLPKLADKWVAAFGPSAQIAAQSLQAEMNRIGTNAFKTAEAFDRATRFSELWRNILVQTNAVLQYLTNNMGHILGLLGAFAGAGVGVAVLFFFSRWNTIIRSVTVGFAALTKAVLAFNVATLATGAGALFSLLARGAVIAGAAAAGYFLMRKETDPLIDSTKELTDQTKLWLDMQEQVGKTQKQVADESRRAAEERRSALVIEVEATRWALQAQLAAEKERQTQLKRLAEVKPSAATPFGGAFFGFIQEMTPEPKEIEEGKARIRQLEALIQEQTDIINRINRLSTTGGGPAEKEPSTQWENWVEKIRQSIRELQGLDAQLKAADLGKTAMEQAKGMAKAIETMADQPDKGRGSLATIAKMLREAGFEGKNLTEQLAKLYTLIEQREEVLRDIEKAPRAIASAGQAIAKAFENLEAKRLAAIFGDPENLSSAQQLERQVVAMARHFDVLKDKAGLSDEQITFMLQHFREQWRITDEAVAESEGFKKASQNIERLRNQLGSRTEKDMEQFADRMRMVNDAWGRGAIKTYEEYAELVQAVNDDMQRKIIERSTLFGRAIAEVFRDIETTTSEILAKITMGQKVGWREMFDSILQEALQFFYKMTVIQPIMKGLFGSLYTKQSGDVGTGMVENWLRGFATPTSSYMSGGVTNIPANAYGGFAPAFASGGSFNVGGVGGTDSQLVAFRATPNERVDILTPEQQRMAGGGGTSIKINVRNETGTPMEAEQGAISFDSEGAVMELVFRRLKRNAGDRDRLAQMMQKPRF